MAKGGRERETKSEIEQQKEEKTQDEEEFGD